MTDQIITYETTMLAKEKGCDILNLPSITQSILQKWLRDEHNIHVYAMLGDGDVYYTFYYMKDNTDSANEVWKFDSYEEALEEGLQRGLKLIVE